MAYRDVKNLNPLATGVSFLFLVLLAISLGARFWADQKSAHYSGPSHITAPNENLREASQLAKLNEHIVVKYLAYTVKKDKM